ncbi:MAG: hypothetical protein IPL88_15610 [Rhizobiales bacterium]|nr:hypothetical protein [Hyphomicrobiales bacterium]
MGAFARAAALCLTLALGGCYELPGPILAKGAPAPIAGRHACVSPDGERSVMTLVQKGGGDDVRFLAQDGAEMKLAPAAGALRVVQHQRKGRYAALFFEVGDGFRVLIADLPDRRSEILALAARHGVTIAGADKRPPSYRLEGPPDAVLAFLAAHDRALLKEISRCARS